MHLLHRTLPVFLLLALSACVVNPPEGGDSSSSSSSSGTSEPATDSEPPPGTTGILTTTMPPTTGTTEGTTEPEPTTSSDSGTSEEPPPDCSGDAPHVLLATSLGDMVVKLDRVNAPNTVDNFISYVESGFYDGTIFHRVVVDFVIQGGGFTTELEEKPTEAPIALEISPNLIHIDGAIGMARTMEEDSATSQFYITHGAQPDLDGGYAVFGALVSGAEVRDAIAMVAVGEENGFIDVPVEDVTLDMAYCVAAP